MSYQVFAASSARAVSLPSFSTFTARRATRGSPVPQAVRKLAGRTVRAVERRGKYLLVDCGDGHLILHLGMSGSLRVLPPGTPAQKHDHFDLVLGDRVLRLRDPRRFGAVLWTADAVHTHPLIANLGLEPLSRALHPARLH